MQIQADISGVTIGTAQIKLNELASNHMTLTNFTVRPIMTESSALGAAIAAGSASGINLWPRTTLPPPSDTFYPTMSEDGD